MSDTDKRTPDGTKKPDTSSSEARKPADGDGRAAPQIRRPRGNLPKR